MELNDSQNSVPVQPTAPVKKIIKLNEIIIDRGLDFVEEAAPDTDDVTVKDTISELETWCAENNLSLSDVYFWIDYINIKILGWDRPLIFVPRSEALLLGFNYVFVLGATLSFVLNFNLIEFKPMLMPSLCAWFTIAAIYGLTLGRRARRRREKLFLPDWQSLALRHKLRQ